MGNTDCSNATAEWKWKSLAGWCCTSYVSPACNFCILFFLLLFPSASGNRLPWWNAVSNVINGLSSLYRYIIYCSLVQYQHKHFYHLCGTLLQPAFTKTHETSTTSFIAKNHWKAPKIEKVPQLNQTRVSQRMCVCTAPSPMNLDIFRFLYLLSWTQKKASIWLSFVEELFYNTVWIISEGVHIFRLIISYTKAQKLTKKLSSLWKTLLNIKLIREQTPTFLASCML